MNTVDHSKILSLIDSLLRAPHLHKKIFEVVHNSVKNLNSQHPPCNEYLDYVARLESHSHDLEKLCNEAIKIRKSLR